MTETTVTHSPEQSRYEIHVDGDLAGFAEYERDGDRTLFTHTEILERHQGEGLASTLAEHALTETAREGHTIVPLCPYIARYLERHDIPDARVERPE